MSEASLICATVTAGTLAGLRRERDAVTGADLVELRLDTVSDPDVDGALAGRPGPVVLTCRPVNQGGHYRGSEESRRALLMRALDAGAEFVDLEWNAGFDGVIRERGGRNVVLSMHDFEGIPADLSARVDAMLATGAEVIKVAVTARCLCDCLPLLTIGSRHAGRRIVLVAMGEAGIPTRVFAARFGSCWTYAGTGVAPGQISVERLVGEFNFRRIRADTMIYGLLGRPISHSLSPAMHNAAFEELEHNAAYVPLAATDIEDGMRFARQVGLAGASVTTPFKVGVIPHLDSSDEVGVAIGAVNTIAWRDGGYVGTNTDASGFLMGLAAARVPDRPRVAVLGTGGAARAVATAFGGTRACVTLYSRSRARADAVATLVGAQAAARPVPPGSWDVLVNATPVGTHPDVTRSAFDEGTYDGRVVYDLVYNPIETRLLRDARAAGCQTISGLEMLIGQAQQQAEWWTGRRPSAACLRGAALRSLAHVVEHA